MDSTSLLIHLIANGYKVYAISFDYGQKHKIELERVKKNIEYLKSFNQFDLTYQVIDLKSVWEGSGSALVSKDVSVPEGHYEEENMVKTVIENRNGIFANIIFAKALILANKYNT